MSKKIVTFLAFSSAILMMAKTPDMTEFPSFPSEWKVFPLVERGYAPSAEELSAIPETLQGKSPVMVTVDEEVDLAPVLGGIQTGATAWLYAELEVPEAMDYEVGAGADWWFAFYCNGEEAFSTLNSGNVLHPPQMTDHKFTVRLHPGRNLFAVKFVSGSGSSVLAMGGPRELALGKAARLAQERRAFYEKRGVPLEVESVVPKDLQDKLAKGLAPEGYVIDRAWNKLLKPLTSTLVAQNSTGNSHGKLEVLLAQCDAEHGTVVILQGEPWLEETEKLYVIIRDSQDRELYGRFGTFAELSAEFDESGVVRVVLPDLRPFKYGKECTGKLQVGVCDRETTAQHDNGVTLGGQAASGERAVLRIEQGTAGPTPMLNGTPFFFNCYTIHPYFPERTIPTGMEGEKSPFNVVACRVGGNSSSADWWKGPGEYDFTLLDWTLDSLLRDFPDAKLGLYVWCHPGLWYAEKYPERIARDENGKPCGGYYVSMVSFSDPAMQEDTLAAIRALVTHCEEYFGSKIVLYNLMGGATCEWQGWLSHSSHFSDYSETSLEQFKKYAAERGVEVDHIPTPEEQKASADGIFRDPAATALVRLYDRFYSESIARFIDRIAGTIKETSHGDKLLGCYYGYHQEYSNIGYTVNRGGHNDTQFLLDSPNMDFFLSPQSYSVRYLGAPNADMKPYGAARIAGKFSVMEDDTRTHLLDECGYGQTINLEQTLTVLKRNAGMYLAHRMPMNELAEHGGDELDDPAIKEMYTHTVAAGQYIMEQQKPDPTEIAAVIDEKAIQFLAASQKINSTLENECYQYDYDGKLFLSPGRSFKPLYGELLGYQRFPLARIGAPVDVILLEDVAKTAGKYKVVIFLNSFVDTPEVREAYQALREKGVAVVTVYGAGFLTPKGVSVESLSELAGMTVANAAGGTLQVAFPEGAKCGGDYTMETRFAVADPEAELLADYADGTAGAVARKGNNYFYGGAYLSPAFLREVVRRQGVHIYLETNDNLYAGAHVLSVHAVAKGEKAIRLPRKCTVEDVYSGETLGEGIDVFTISMEAMETRVFLLK